MESRLVRVLRGHSGQANACAFSPDGKRIVSASHDETLKLWEAETGVCEATLEGHGDSVRACAFSPDGKRIVSASHDETLKLWDARTGVCEATLEGHDDWVWDCAFSPDGERIVSAGNDKILKLWDARTGECQATLEEHGNSVWGCAFSPDGKRVVSASLDRTLKLWDARTGECETTLEGHDDMVVACAFSPDGATIVSGSWDDTLKLWDAHSGAELATLVGHTGSVEACVFSPDGATIVSAGGDKTVKLWDAETGRELGGVAVTCSLLCVAVHPGAPRLACGDMAGAVSIVDVHNLEWGGGGAAAPDPEGANDDAGASQSPADEGEFGVTGSLDDDDDVFRFAEELGIDLSAPIHERATMEAANEAPEPTDPVLRDTERNERRALRWLADQVALGHAADLDLDEFAVWVFGREDEPSMIGQLHNVLGGSFGEPERLAAGRVIYSPSTLGEWLLAAGRPALSGAFARGLRPSGPRATSVRARSACLWAVFKLGGDATHEIIAGVLPESDRQTRFEIVRILGFMGDRRATRVLVEALAAESSAKNRSDILWALGTLADPAALQPCVEALDDASPEARGYAAWALGEMGDPAALVALRGALDDPDAEVRGWVAKAVLKLESSA